MSPNLSLTGATMPDVHKATLRLTRLPGVRAATFLSNRSFPRHTHDEYGIGVMQDGAQRSWSGRGFVNSQAGDLITVNPGEMHDGIPAAGCTRRWHMLYIETAAIAELADVRQQSALEFTQPSVHDPRGSHAFEVAFSRALDADCGLALEAALHSLLLGRAVPRTGSSDAGYVTPPIQRAVELINAAPAAHHSLGSLAAAAGVSKFHLLRGFAARLGVTPHAYLMQRRVRHAQSAITGGATLADAAYDSGFADQSHMTRAFVRQYGITPGQRQSAR